MLAVLLISPQCVKNFSDNFNKIHQEILANFSEQLMNKTDFNSKINLVCLLLPECGVKNRVFVFKESAKKVSSHSGDQLFTRCFATYPYTPYIYLYTTYLSFSKL